MKRDPDLTPLPVWRQYLARYRAAWRGSKDRRKQMALAFVSLCRVVVSLAFHVGGGTLISYGVYLAYAPAGYVAGGIICWLLAWSTERDLGRNG